MVDRIRATPQSPALAQLAAVLRTGRDVADKVQIPYLGGLGQMLMGKAPEEVEEWSYGNAPLTVPEMTRVPQFKRGRAESLADTVMAAPLARPPLRMITQLPNSVRKAAIDFALASGVPTTNVVKHKGGNWLANSVEGALAGLKRQPTISGEAIEEVSGRPLFADYRKAYDNGGETVGLHEWTQKNHPDVYNSLLDPSDIAVNNWVDKQLTRYVKNEMATPEDPVRALAERGVLHWAPQETAAGARIRAQRVREGFPENGMAGPSDLAQTWETNSDNVLRSDSAGALLEDRMLGNGENPHLRQNPWLQKVPPETRVSYADRGADLRHDLGFDHLLDELRNATDPTSGLPPELLLKYSSLNQVSVPQAVERVSNINAWRAAQKAEADMARANNAATVLHKDYPDKGFKWVELRKPQDTGEMLSSVRNDPRFEIPQAQQDRFHDQATREAMQRNMDDESDEFRYFVEQRIAELSEAWDAKNPNVRDFSVKQLEDALKYEGDTMGHCVGGYCPDVAEGRSRIYSLRDAKGQPHVTVEVKPGSDDPLAEVFRQLPHEEQLRIREAALGAEAAPMDKFLLGREADANRALVRNQMLKENPAWAELKAPESIVQIKGKANRAPNDEYLPFVQDFVKSGRWSDVGDLGHTGLRKSSDAFNSMELEKLRSMGIEDVPQWVTGDDLNSFAEKLGSGLKYDAKGRIVGGYASGGLVEQHTAYDPSRIQTLADALRAEFA
jgi:hypothetical protein